MNAPKPNFNPSSQGDFLSFDDIFAELHYHQAQRTLRSLLDNLDLSPRERRGLEAEIDALQAMVEKLENQVIRIVVFGMVGRGKSSVLNALLGQDVFATGPIHGVTQRQETAQWDLGDFDEDDDYTMNRQIAYEQVFAGSEREITRVSLSRRGQARLELIDTPGIDEVDGAERAELAQTVAQNADLILFVVAGDMTKVEYEALSALRQASKPMLLVFNKIDQYPPQDRLTIYAKIRDERVRQLLTKDEIVMTAAAPLVAKAVFQADGSVTAELVSGKPQIEDLKLKILEVLDREGKSLAALNSLLFADMVHERVVQRKLFVRDHQANQLIWRAVITTAAAIALNPVTVIDILSTAIIDVSMIVALAKLYGLPMSQKGAMALMQKIALGMGGITAGEFLANFGLSSLKSLLGIAAPVTGGLTLGGYLSVAITQAAVAGFSTYTLGLVTKEYLANGASWGEEGPKAAVKKILDTIDENSILARIKDELKSKLDLTNGGFKSSEGFKYRD